MTLWTDMATVIPEGEKGSAQIKHFTVTEEDSSKTSIRAMITGDRGAYVPPGTYAKLILNGGVMMSDTQMERTSNVELILHARGHVIVAGLGVGMVVVPLLQKKGVTKVTVIEKNQDVIDLVEAPLRAYLGKKASCLEVIQADIFEYTPPKGVKYDTIYFDIWQDITFKNLPEMSTLHRRFARRKADSEVWVESWMRRTLKHRKKKQDEERKRYGKGYFYR